MRFLCFHGKGTNARVFEKQTARLRQALAGRHEFIFINGAVPAEPAPGFDSAVESSQRWFREDVDLAQQRALHDDVLRVIEAQAPLDGLMGFSEGGAVAAYVLVQDAQRGIGRFKCAIFFSAAMPADPDLFQTGTFRYLDADRDGIAVNIPTAHIWSEAGDICPGMGKKLARLFNEDLREEFVHHLGHNIPGSISDEGLAGAVRVVERTIERART